MTEIERKQIVSARFAVNLRSSSSLLPAVFALAVALLFCVSPSPRPIFAKPSARTVAPATCESCHAGDARSYANAPMRHAMEPEDANPQLIAHSDISAHIGPYTYEVQTRNGHSTYTVSDGTGKVTVPIHWIFGQHSQTWLFEMDGHFYETLVSYFHRNDSLASTPGDQEIIPQNLNQAMGRHSVILTPKQSRNSAASVIGHLTRYSAKKCTALHLSASSPIASS